MGAAAVNTSIWVDIERSESYLICSLYEEAASLSFSVLKRLCNSKLTGAEVDLQLQDMIESAGMVLVQSLKELGRASDIHEELKKLFQCVATIPVQVVIVGACIQISDGWSSGVREFLEEFLGMWRCAGGDHYVLLGAEGNVDTAEGCDGHFVLGVDKYLEVVEIYAVKLLGTVLNDTDMAISWIERAALPEEKRQELLRRLSSLNSHKATSSSQTSSPLSSSESKGSSCCSKDLDLSAKFLEALPSPISSGREKAPKQPIMKLSRHLGPCFWWFHSINLKFANVRLAVSTQKLFVGFLVILIFYVFRKKHFTLKRIVGNQISLLRKALVDLWQLAFSYQVSPLASVPSLPAATHGSQNSA